MGKRTSRGKSNEARPPAAEDRTQQLQVIGENTQPDGAEHTPGEVTEVVAEGATNEPGVTQETVPMPAAVWPPRTQKESPNRPPPLRGAPPEIDAGSHMVPTQKPGLLTTELRRALPP